MRDMRLRVLVGFGLGALASGCAVAPTRGYPLYPAPGPRPPVTQVAALSAWLPSGAAPEGGASNFIKAVDGRDVSAVGPAFELLPGCHVVETASQLVVADATVMWSGELGPRAFVFPMKAGYGYMVVVDLKEGMSGTGRLSIYGVEQDPTGKQTATFAPVAPDAAAQACQNPGKPAGDGSGKAPGVTSVAPAALPRRRRRRSGWSRPLRARTRTRPPFLS